MATSGVVADVLPEFADAFPFESFNPMQRAVLPAILESEANVVVGAPTASGKTALAELAICRTLRRGGTALFLAPMRALTNEKEAEWERFEALGYSVYVVTGERELAPRRAERADILVMTPEKADLATRKADSTRYGFVADVECCVIDEVHLLDSHRRGPVLEVTVARLRRLCDPRIVALSASMPNVDDVADWLDAPPECTFRFDAEYRPVPLHAGVETYAHGENAFADKYRRLYRALDLVEPHLTDDGQALVFVATRSDTVRAAEKAREELDARDVAVGTRGEYDRHTESRSLENETLRECVLDGVGFHHAGLSRADRDLVEEWFRTDRIQLLFSTSTLAWGVNLPARCVVIRDTHRHDPLEGEVEMSPLDVRQMLGRAGRPGYDDAGYASVICDAADADRYRRLLREGTPIESRLSAELATHLNAEVALGGIADVGDVHAWLETTYYASRAAADDTNRDATDGTAPDPHRKRVADALQRLDADGFLDRRDDALEATALGRLAARYYLDLETARTFADLAETTDQDAVAEGDILRTVACAAAFDDVAVRRDEREAAAAVVPEADLLPGPRKVLAILRARTTGSIPSALEGDAWVIRRNALRLLSALRAFVEEFGGPRPANRVRRVEARVEHGLDGDRVALTAIDGVGRGRAEKLAESGLETPVDVRAAGTADLEAAGLSTGLAERVHERASALPSIDVTWNDVPDRIEHGANAMGTVVLANNGEGEPAGVRVTVNGVEMTAATRFLGEARLPVAVYGGDAATLTLEVEVAFPALPLAPVTDRRVVSVE